jgi:methionyl-tRNA formyltransferase
MGTPEFAVTTLKTLIQHNYKVVGILPITNYRKKEFSSEVSKSLLQKLNIKIRLA